MKQSIKRVHMKLPRLIDEDTFSTITGMHKSTLRKKIINKIIQNGGVFYVTVNVSNLGKTIRAAYLVDEPTSYTMSQNRSPKYTEPARDKERHQTIQNYWNDPTNGIYADGDVQAYQKVFETPPNAAPPEAEPYFKKFIAGVVEEVMAEQESNHQPRLTR